MQVKKQQLEPCMEQLTGSGLRKEFDKVVYCNPIYLIYTQSKSCKVPGWMSYKLESRLPVEISTTSDMWMIPLSWESKEPLDGGEGGESKGWLKIKY